MQGQIPLHKKLSTTAKNVLVLLVLKSSLLISLMQLCDDNCNIELDKKELRSHKNNQLMLKGNIIYQDTFYHMSTTKAFIQDNNYYSILNQSQHQKTHIFASRKHVFGL